MRHPRIPRGPGIALSCLGIAIAATLPLRFDLAILAFAASFFAYVKLSGVIEGAVRKHLFGVIGSYVLPTMLVMFAAFLAVIGLVVYWRGR